MEEEEINQTNGKLEAPLNDQNLFLPSTSTFDPITLKNIFKLIWKEKSTRITNDSLKLSAEFIRIFVCEALERAHREAIIDGSPTILPTHLEKVIVQLLFDF